MGSDVRCAAVSAGCEDLRTLPPEVGSADFREFAEALPHMVWICAPDGRLRYLNSMGVNYFGSALRDVSHLFPAGTLFHEKDHDQCREAWDKASRGPETLTLEARLQRHDGSFRWHLIRAHPVLDDTWRIARWMGACTDMHAARESAAVTDFLLQLSTECARIEDPHDLLCTAMLRLRDRLGVAQVTVTELDNSRGTAVLLMQGPPHGSALQVTNLGIEGFEPLMVAGHRGEMTVVGDLRREQSAELAELHERWYGLNAVAAIVSAPMLQAGSLVASLSIVETSPRDWSPAEVDLTRRVAEIVWPALEKARSDRAVAVSEQRLRLAQAVAQIGTWELDPGAESVLFSPESYELFGLDAQGADTYQRWTAALERRDGGALPALIAACRIHGTGETEFRYQHPQRGLRWIYSRAGMIRAGERDFLVGVSLDVTARRQAEEALQEVNQRKDDFLAMLAHELRNPLAPIRNAAQILRVHAQNQPELEWARMIIDRQTRHLARLVDDLLDVSRILRGRIVLQKSAVEINEVVQHAVEMSQPLIRARHHQLLVNVSCGTAGLEGDLTRLAQVLANILNNAAKYTAENGKICLDVWQERARVALRVRDTGPGLPAVLLPHVFDLFTQAERPLDRSQGGLGIGLTLVKLLVEMHGGSVHACNTEQGGAEFTIYLPLGAPRFKQMTPAGSSAQTVAAAPAERPIKVLVVDDNVDAADSVALLLTMDGFDAHSVHSSAAALETVRALNPDVMLLDIGLPIMDGYELARRLRAEIPARQMRIVALSGYGQAADREKAAGAGFDAYLVKPIEPAELSGFLRSLQ